MNRIKRAGSYLSAVLSILFLILSDDFLKNFIVFPCNSLIVNIVTLKICTIFMVFVVLLIFVFIQEKTKRKVILKGNNYEIVIEYGDIFKKDDCKKIISFDSCFTTKVGDRPEEINPSSICGQYLSKYPIEDIDEMLEKWNIASNGYIEIGDKIIKKYNSGTIVPCNDYLLLAFAHLDNNGLGEMLYDEYLNCLSIMWKELDKYYNGTDVCMPILGAGITRFCDVTLTKQELLDTIIYSYKLNRRKLNLPNKLHIICTKSDDFSLNNISAK